MTQEQIQIENSNSNENQNNIQNFETIEIINVDKKVYSTLLSVIDSSEKSKYYWNRPIKVSENIVKFVKYKIIDDIEVLHWKIIIIKYDKKVVISVYAKGEPIAELIINKTYPFHYVIRISGVEKEFKGEGLFEFEKYYITTNDMPNAMTIVLSEIASKLLYFYRKAKPVFG